MSHNILSLQQDRFDTRILFGGCLININGETFDCNVIADRSNFHNPTYTVTDANSKAVLCTFRPYHLIATGVIGALSYQIEGASRSGAEATLIVPRHGMVSGFGDAYGEDEGFGDDTCLADAEERRPMIEL